MDDGKGPAEKQGLFCVGREQCYRGAMDQRVYTGAPWEKTVAYCRARRVGSHIFVAGTTAVDEQGNIVHPGDMYGQTAYVFKKIEGALKKCGAEMSHIVRTRMFITDMNRFDEMAKAHGEALSGIDPAATCVEVSALVDPHLLIEIEVDAIVPES